MWNEMTTPSILKEMGSRLKEYRLRYNCQDGTRGRRVRTNPFKCAAFPRHA